jgi:hypothetical protein
MKSLLSLAFLLLPIRAITHSKGNCIDLTIPITATAENALWKFPELKDAYQVASFFNLITQRDGDPSAVVAGVANVTETFAISARFCTPGRKSPKSNIVHLLSHGLGFDKR